MKLFANKPRYDLDYAKPDESTFSFLNRSGREEFLRVRKKLNDWFLHYPKEERFELKSRLQKKEQFDAAFFELFIHEFFYSKGYELSVHPKLMNSSKQPDFLVTSDNKPLFYLEAKVVRDESDKERIYKEKQERISFELDKLANFPYWISIDELIIKTQNSFSVKPVIQNIRKTAETFNYIEMLRNSQSKMINFDDNNISITIRCYPRNNSNFIGQNRAVGVMGYFEGGVVTTDLAISKAIEKKARKYGKTDLPLVIAINCTTKTPLFIMDMESVLGKDYQFMKSNKPIPSVILTTLGRGIYENSYMDNAASLFITSVTPFHQNDEIWFWCENPKSEFKNLNSSIYNQLKTGVT